MKKALIVTSVGGFLQRFENRNVRILQEMDYEVHYATNFRNPIYAMNQEEMERRGIILHSIDVEKSPKQIRENAAATGELKQIIDRCGIDLVHCHNPMGGAAARLAADRSKRKPYVIYTAHGFHFYRGAPYINQVCFKTVEEFLARKTDLLVTINHEDYEQGKKMSLRKPGNCWKIPGAGVDMNRFRPNKEAGRQVRLKLGIPEEAIHIVTAAELNENKNQRVIIEAIRQTGRDDIYYTLCGKGPTAGKLAHLIQEIGLTGRVQMIGYRTDMERILCSADLFAFPSIREGFGLAAVEALACGVPLIIADNRGSREYARQGSNAIVCQSNDIEGFCEAILKMADNPQMRRRMAEQCRQSAKPFDIENTAAVMQQVYGNADKSVRQRK